jgi:hypothetical protein
MRRSSLSAFDGSTRRAHEPLRGRIVLLRRDGSLGVACSVRERGACPQRSGSKGDPVSARSPKASHRTAAPSRAPLRNGATVARGIGRCRSPHPRSVLSASEIDSTTRGVASCVARDASPHAGGCTARGLRTASTGRRALSSGRRLVLMARVSVGTWIPLVHRHHLSLVAYLAAPYRLQPLCPKRWARAHT